MSEKQNEKRKRIYDNFTMLKALDEVDKEKAIQVISEPNLDGKELSELLETSMLGRVVNKNTGKPLELSKEVLMAGLRNKLNQVIRNAEEKEREQKEAEDDTHTIK